MKKLPFLALPFMTMAGPVSPTVDSEETESLVMIDVRTEKEWLNGHLKGAILIPYDQIGQQIGTVVKEKSQKIYLYCRTGRRVKIAQETLYKLGYQDVVNLGSLENAADILKISVVK